VAGRLAADLLRAAVFLRAAIRYPLPGQDAMRFRRRRSRSLMPPQTPYRSSLRSA
jgi:hypothetical protein